MSLIREVVPSIGAKLRPDVSIWADIAEKIRHEGYFSMEYIKDAINEIVSHPV